MNHRDSIVATADDPRLEAFAAWLASVDRRDIKKGLEASRELRKLGVSVVLIHRPPDSDRRGR